MKRLKADYERLTSDQRLYRFDRPIIGLTGGIATGKSTVSRLLQEQGLQVIDADQMVKSIYATGEAQGFIKDNFPEVWVNGVIDFRLLRERFFKEQESKALIEDFIYQRLPKVFSEAAKKTSKQDFYIYDVPLLFERGLSSLVDLSIVVYAPKELQLSRLIGRDGTGKETAERILSQQLDIEEKKSRADFVIINTGSFQELSREVEKLLEKILR